MNPEPFTLRELVWMARERKRVWGELTGFALWYIRYAVWAEDGERDWKKLNLYDEREQLDSETAEELKRLEEWQANRKLAAIKKNKGV